MTEPIATTADAPDDQPEFPGLHRALDGTDAIVEMETAASEAAGAYPITPSTQMGEGWALAAAQGKLNVNGRRLLFFEPEGEHAAAAVTAGMAMVGLRSANFSSGQGIAYMHESLYAAAGKRLTYVLNMACRAMTKHALNVHAGHDDYHAVDDTGFFQLFAKNAQEAADLNLITHRVAELALTPGICAQDGFLTSHVIESVSLPEPELVARYLGDPNDLIESPTPAQRVIFGDTRRRIPEMFDLDNPTMSGVVQNQDSYAQGVAAQRPFFFDHVAELTDRAMDELFAFTARRYRRAIGYRMEDAEYVLLGQGTVVGNAEAVADWLRTERGLKVGVVNITMFRPFPADLVSSLLAGCKAVLVLERVDQPLSADPPLLREIRGAMGQAVENQRGGNGSLPYPDLAVCSPSLVPDFYSGCFGLGSRDLQAGDLIAAVENMLPGRRQRRQFYLGIEFVRPGAAVGAIRDEAQPLLELYPHLAELALRPAENVDLLPDGSIAVRIHSVGGWGAITMGKNLTHTLFDLLGLHVKSNPKYGSEKKGQPTTFYAVFAHHPVRINCELKHVDVVLSPDPNVFRHSNPLAGLAAEGTFVIQHHGTPEELWRGLPPAARKIIRDRQLRVFHLDAFAIARAETEVADLQFRMQGAAFQGAFFRTSPILERESLDEGRLFTTIEEQLQKKFGHRGTQVVEDNFRVIRRGFDEVVELDWAAIEDGVTPDEETTTPGIDVPWRFREDVDTARGVADPFRFAEAICGAYSSGEDPTADPFAALSAIPAATGVFRDMTGIRFEVPDFIAERCTGCAQCWTQCPDAAIPGLVTEVEPLLRTVFRDAGNGHDSARFADEVVPHIAAAARELLKEGATPSFAGAVARAWSDLSPDLALTNDERSTLDATIDAAVERLRDFPVATTAPFFTVPERREEGSGGLLSVTINPFACKGCNLCVEVCPDDALVSIPQDDTVVDRLRRNWSLWEQLPDTPDRFVQVSDIDEGIGVLQTLLLQKKNFHSMVGGDGACMGCGEKTGVHLITAAIEAASRPHAAELVATIERLLEGLKTKASELLIAHADLESIATAGSAHLDVEVSDDERDRLTRISRVTADLEDLHWRYTSGPSGRGRAALGISNSTGCSSVWGSTYPFNPYPYPWTNHLFQDAPSIAIGIFEGLMRKMADAFAAVRTAELELADAYVEAEHGPFFEGFNWEEFTDEEFRLCPPMVVIGGDGAMLDIGFQNVSRLLASGKPIRIVVLDTQVYSNTGGQACTSGFHGQVSDMAAFGAARHGKTEHRKEMALIAMAHRNTFVLQTSQALPAHLMAGVLQGLGSRRPAIFNIYTPCQAEHGLPDHGSARAAKLALEGRAFSYLVYDPDGGETFPERLSLDGNPAIADQFPTYELTYVDDDGREQTMTLPMTTADWAATEPRFKPHFRVIPRAERNGHHVPFGEYLELGEDERRGKTPHIVTLDADRRIQWVRVSPEMVALTEDRLSLWDELRELAGLKIPARVEKTITRRLEKQFETELDRVQQEYETKIADLKSRYPAEITRKIAEAIVSRGANALGSAAGIGGAMAPAPAPAVTPPPPVPVAPPLAAVAEPVVAEPAVTEASPEPEAESMDDALEPWIETVLCTSCDECTRLNPAMFEYNEDKQAFIKDPRAGTFRELVLAAEKCTARIIHVGTPLDAEEEDLDVWVGRGAEFQ